MCQYFIDQVLEEVEAATDKVGLDLLGGLQDSGLFRFFPEVKPLGLAFAGMRYLVGKLDTKQEIFCCHKGTITCVESS